MFELNGNSCVFVRKALIYCPCIFFLLVHTCEHAAKSKIRPNIGKKMIGQTCKDRHVEIDTENRINIDW